MRLMALAEGLSPSGPLRLTPPQPLDDLIVTGDVLAEDCEHPVFRHAWCQRISIDYLIDKLKCFLSTLPRVGQYLGKRVHVPCLHAFG